MGTVPRRLPVMAPLVMAMLLVVPASRPSLSRVAAQGDAAVEIQDFTFSPATLEVTVGTTVTWTNTGDATHTVTSDDGLFDSGDLANGGTFSFTFEQAGTFAYHCSIHNSMKAAIVVKAAGNATGGNASGGNTTAGNTTAGNTNVGNAPAGNATAGGEAVEIQDFTFSPATLQVPVGTTVIWTNTGKASHTVTADDGSFDSGKLDPGKDFSFTFDQAGEFSYHCAIHPTMKAKIVVTSAAAGNATAEATPQPTAEPTQAAIVAASATATNAPSGPATIVGGATDGTNALEYVGRLDQRGNDLTIYGYLTHIAGLDDAQLFTDADPTKWSEGTARFTFFGSAKLTSREVVTNSVIATAAEGSVKFFLNEKGGGSFDRPESFLSGTPLAAAGVRIHDVLSVYAKNKGIANGDASLVWTSNTPFALDGKNVQLGKVDGRHRLTFSGLGTLEDANGPRATVSIGGSSVSIAAPAAAAAGATPAAGGNATAGGNEVTIKLGELNNSGISGTAILRANGNKTDVELHLNGATGGHPAHIHRGTCKNLDPNPAFPLPNVDANGDSKATVAVSLADLEASPFAINIHKSADEIGIYVACGEIKS